VSPVRARALALASRTRNPGTPQRPARVHTQNTEEAEQRASQALLESTGPDIIKASREAGVGAMSDAEMNSYLRAGPSERKTKEQNEVLIEKAKTIANIQEDYADYLDWYRNQKGTMQGAETLWRSYKERNPLFIEKGKELVFNAGRQPWGDFVVQSQGAGPVQGLSQVAPAATSYDEALAEARRRGLVK